MRDKKRELESDLTRTEPEDPSESPLFNRRRILSAAGVAGATLTGIGAFSGTAAAWERLEMNFRECSEVWIITDEEDFDYRKYGRLDPLSVTVVVETSEGEAECRTVEVTEESTTTVPGQYGDAPIVQFSPDDGETVLAVISYNHNDVAHCYFENANGCAQGPNVANWRDAECAEDLLEHNPDRFNVPCTERWRNESESETGSGNGTGPGSETGGGSETGSGTSTGSATGSGSGPATGNGSGPATGSGTETGSGVSSPPARE